MNLEKYLPLDKCYHLIAGFIIFSLLSVVIDRWALVPVIAAAVLKELYDKYTGKGTPDWKDAAYTIAGGLLGLLCTY